MPSAVASVAASVSSPAWQSGEGRMPMRKRRRSSGNTSSGSGRVRVARAHTGQRVGGGSGSEETQSARVVLGVEQALELRGGVVRDRACRERRGRRAGVTSTSGRSSSTSAMPALSAASKSIIQSIPSGAGPVSSGSRTGTGDCRVDRRSVGELERARASVSGSSRATDGRENVPARRPGSPRRARTSPSQPARSRADAAHRVHPGRIEVAQVARRVERLARAPSAPRARLRVSSGSCGSSWMSSG